MKKYCTYVMCILLSLLCLFGVACAPNDTESTETFATHQDVAGAFVKKGVCVHRYKTSSIPNGERVDDLNVGWWYNWGPRPLNEYVESEFVPMVWGRQHMNEDDLGYIEQGYRDGKFKKLLTFNEPDLSVQANLTVDEALAYWPRLEQIGIPLSSPAVSYYSPTDGNEWLDSFMEKAIESEYRVDFIAIHLYQSFYSKGVVQQLKDTLDALYEKYGLPVWLTEFGSIDIIARDSGAVRPSASCTQKNTNTYITDATNMLERCGYVEGYAWFLDNFDQSHSVPWEAPYTSLYNTDDTISDTGTAYQGVTSNFPLVLQTPSLTAVTQGQCVEQKIAVAGGTGNYTFKASGLPKGFTFSAGGVLRGTAEQKGIYPIVVTVSDSATMARKQTLTRKFVLTVA